MKEPNEGRPGRPEEVLEGRAGAQENRDESYTDPTQSGDIRVTGIHPCAPTRAGRGNLSEIRRRQISKVGAVCGSAARTDLCGGRSAMTVPTATFGEGPERNVPSHFETRSRPNSNQATEGR